MSRYVLAVDQSTTATKAIIFNERAELIGRCDVLHRQIHPQPGWVEHDPTEIYSNVVDAIRDVLQKTCVDKQDIAVLAITNQRETTVIWDANGKPVYNAIVWQCFRADNIIKLPEISQNAEKIEQTTGLKLSPYFSAAKARWIVDHTTAEGPLYFGTMDSWLVYKLTGRHATDTSNASRTQLFNIHTLCWDETILELFGLQSLNMPQVLGADAIYGYTTVEGIFDEPIPVAGVMGDSHGALFGQSCWKRGMGKATMGTGSSVMMNIGDTPLHTSNGLATSVAWTIANTTEYVLEGNIICSGDTLKWLIEDLDILPEANQSAEYAQKIPSSQGVYLVPAFVGLGAPYWNSDARAIICGLFRNANKYHVVRAGLESIAYQIKDVVSAMLLDAQIELDELRVDGGPTGNTMLMQFMADILGTTIIKKDLQELSALGAAYAGGLAVGIWSDKDEIGSLRRVSSAYYGNMPKDQVDEIYHGWKAAVRMAMGTTEKN